MFNGVDGAQTTRRHNRTSWRIFVLLPQSALCRTLRTLYNVEMKFEIPKNSQVSREATHTAANTETAV